MVLKEGLNGRNTEEGEIRQPEDSALKILPQLWLVSSILGAKGKRQRSLDDILQKSHTLHTLLNSPLVSGIKTIFTEGIIQCQLYMIKIRSCSCKWQVMFGKLFCAYLLCNILQCCHMWFAVFNSYSFSALHSPDHNCVFFFPIFLPCQFILLWFIINQTHICFKWQIYLRRSGLWKSGMDCVNSRS